MNVSKFLALAALVTMAAACTKSNEVAPETKTTEELSAPATSSMDSTSGATTSADTAAAPTATATPEVKK